MVPLVRFRWFRSGGFVPSIRSFRWFRFDGFVSVFREEQSRNSDDSEAESDKRKKLALAKWIGSLICKLIND